MATTIFIKLTVRVICRDYSEGSWWIDSEQDFGFIARTNKDIELGVRHARCEGLVAALHAVIDNNDKDLDYELDSGKFLGIQVTGISKDDGPIYRQFIQEIWES